MVAFYPSRAKTLQKVKDILELKKSGAGVSPLDADAAGAPTPEAHRPMASQTRGTVTADHGEQIEPRQSYMSNPLWLLCRNTEPNSMKIKEVSHISQHPDIKTK